MKKILITGGHLSPAVALIEAIQDEGITYDLVFAGRKYAFEDDTAVSQEYKSISALNVRFYAIVTGRLQRTLSWQSIRSLLKVPVGVAQSFFMCVREKPDVIMSFGGYIALPVVLSGWILRIPIITHEQTTVLGLANSIIVKFSTVVCVAQPEMTQIKHRNVVVTGLPIRREIVNPVTRPSFSVPLNRPILFISGGTTGAETLNVIVFSSLPELLKKFTVLHQTGNRSLEAAKAVSAALPGDTAKQYVIQSYFQPQDVGWILKHCSFVISRSGANSVAEFMATACPALLIPLPWAGGSEQLHNAEKLVNAGMGVILPQRILSKETLLKYTDNFFGKLSEYKTQAQKVEKTVTLNGTKRLLDQLERILS